MKINVRPLGEKILVRRDSAEKVSKGGIIIPDVAQEKCIHGVVVRVGSGKELSNGKVRPLDVKEGQRVYFTKYSGTDFKDPEGNDLLMLYEADVMAVEDV